MTETVLFRRNLFLTTPMMRGSDVVALQGALKSRGSKLEQDGVFGLATQTALRAFQAAVGLVQDGMAGPATWAKLFDQAPVGGGASTSDSVARHCFDFFVGRDWSTAQAAGIIANIRQESNFQPELFGDAGLAYGLAQWHPPRQAAFRAQYNHSIIGSTIDEQLAFIHFELNSGSERGAGARLRGATSAQTAGEIVSRFYERPRAADEAAQLRGQTAEIYFQVFQAGGTPQNIPLPPAPPALLYRATDIVGPRAMHDLLTPHSQYPGAVSWALTTDGVKVGDSSANATALDMNSVRAFFHRRADALAAVLIQKPVPIELVLAGAGTAAAQGDAPRLLLGCDTDRPARTPDRVTAGLMQTRLDMARLALNQSALGPDDLRSADTAIRAGAGAIWLQAAETGFDPPLVAAAYGAGGLLYDPSQNNRWRLMHEVPGNSAAIDRFVAMFNAAMQVTAGIPLPDGVPTFHALIQTVNAPTLGSANGPYIAPDPGGWSGTPLVGSGECVALVQHAAGAPLTKYWRKGPKVQNNADIEPGTAIATFGADGRYANLPGGSHAALFLSQDPLGISVVDQWNIRTGGVITDHHPPKDRTIRFNNPVGQPVDQGELFFVIL